MPASRPLVSLCLAAGMFLASAAESSAFSKIGRQDGTLPDEDGVVSTPLPPLTAPNAGSKAPPPENDAAAGTPTPQGGAAQPPAAQTPAAGTPPVAPGGNETTPPPSGGDTATPVQPPAGRPSATPSAPVEDDDAAGTTDGGEDGTDPAASQQATPEKPTGPPADVVYGDSELPAPVRDLRARLIEIAKTGEIEKLRPYIEPGEDGTVLSFGGVEGDPIDFLKTASGDGDGVETLAILLEVLEAGHIKSEPGTDNEIYIWPYFSGLTIDKLTKPQKVELFELVTAGDYQEMVAFGAYNFYRVGISPDGKLQFFVAGD